MAWFSLLSAVIKLVGMLAGYARDRQLITGAQATVLANALEAQADDIDKGRKARLDQRLRDSGADAGGLSDDADPFRRD